MALPRVLRVVQGLDHYAFSCADELDKGKDLEDAPQPLGVRRAREDDQMLARAHEYWQAREALRDVSSQAVAQIDR